MKRTLASLKFTIKSKKVIFLKYFKNITKLINKNNDNVVDIDAHNKSTDLSLTDTDLNKTDRSTSQLTNLKGLIDGLLEQQTDNIELDEFYECFERCHGWKLEYKEYGFKSYDEFITEIVRLGFIEVGLIDDSVNNFMIICPKKTNVYSMPRKTVNSSPEDKVCFFLY